MVYRVCLSMLVSCLERVMAFTTGIWEKMTYRYCDGSWNSVIIINVLWFLDSNPCCMYPCVSILRSIYPTGLNQWTILLYPANVASCASILSHTLLDTTKSLVFLSTAQRTWRRPFGSWLKKRSCIWSILVSSQLNWLPCPSKDVFK